MLKLLNEEICILTIIVSVYNVKKYIGRCLDSLMKIERSDIEIICINDGSADESEIICSQYAEKDNRIKVVSQCNKGLPAVRNKGLSIARGDYIAFVDSDDWVDAQMFEDFIHIMENDSTIDICVSGSVRSYPDGEEEEMFERVSDCTLSAIDALREMVSGRICFWYLWGKVYRRDLFDDFWADESVATCEDLDSLWQLFNKNKTIKNVWISSKYNYHYYVNSGSMTEGTKRWKRYESDLYVFKKILLSPKGVSDEETINKIRMRALLTIYYLIRESVFYNDEILAKQYLVEAKDIMNDICVPIEEDKWLIEKLNEMLSDEENPFSLFNCAFDSLREIASDITGEEKVYLYGTGIVSQYFVDILEREKACDFINGYIISDNMPSICFFRNKPVYHLSELPVGIKTIVLSLNKRNQEQVMTNLKESDENKIIRPEIPDHF